MSVVVTNGHNSTSIVGINDVDPSFTGTSDLKFTSLTCVPSSRTITLCITLVGQLYIIAIITVIITPLQCYEKPRWRSDCSVNKGIFIYIYLLNSNNEMKALCTWQWSLKTQYSDIDVELRANIESVEWTNCSLIHGVAATHFSRI